MQEVQSVEVARDKATYNIAQARTKSLGQSLKAVPGTMVEGPREAGQGH